MTVPALAVLVPPFQNSDEPAHMLRADQIASGRLIAARYGGPETSGGKIDLGILRAAEPTGPLRFHAERKMDAAMRRQAAQVRWGDRGRFTFGNTAPYPPFFYAPAALVIAVGKKTGASVVDTLIAARIGGGLASVAIAAAAIAASGWAAPLLFALLTLPMTLSLFAALSQDGPLIATAALAAAFFVRLSKRENGALGLAATLALLGMARPAYVAFAALALAASLLRFPIRLAITASAVLAAGAWIGLAAHFTTVLTSASRHVDPVSQLAQLAAHPGRLGGLIGGAFGTHQGMEGLPFYDEFVGVLGSLDVVLPTWFYWSAGVMLVIAAMLCIADRPAPPRWRDAAIVAGAGGAAVVGVFALEYLTFTPVGLAFVEGVQGRYFLPVAMLLPLALPSVRLPGLRRLEWVLAGFAPLAGAVAISAAVTRYYP